MTTEWKKQILVVDDDTDMLRLISMRLSAADYHVLTAESAEHALNILALERPQLVLSDVRLPGKDGLELFYEIQQKHPSIPVILLTAHGTIPDAIEATSQGVFSYLTKPFDGKELLQKIKEALDLNPSAVPRRSSAINTDWRKKIISRSNIMEDLLAEAKMVATSDASIMLLGESGTGKELLAQAIHECSPRSKSPFIAINCSAIPENLLESELFGHVKGAFTDASSHHKGLFQEANKGTLMLDEVGDMPLSAQVKLLRALQEQMVRPVGSAQSIPIDVRIISATNKNLEESMQEGGFREDLYYRLNVITLYVPPLSERREDIPLLANHFLKQLVNKYQKKITGFSPDALKTLTTANWPGNIRQLRNVVEQVCALCTTPLVSLTLVERALRTSSVEILSYTQAKQQFEREYLINLMKITDGVVADAARLADRNRTEFYRLLQKNGLTPGQFAKKQVQEPD